MFYLKSFCLQHQAENYSHPQICFFHVLFKGAALAFYILSSLFVNSFVIIFVVTVPLAALDFWVVKNVSGRILVGLRWWNEINDDGGSVWKFECLDQKSLARMNKKDSWLFGWTLYLTNLYISVTEKMMANVLPRLTKDP
ncbi:hypothetical protein ACS0TY_026380 [Phlomoides rotata]